MKDDYFSDITSYSSRGITALKTNRHAMQAKTRVSDSKCLLKCKWHETSLKSLRCQTLASWKLQQQYNKWCQDRFQGEECH
jgi:hypothetical protein